MVAVKFSLRILAFAFALQTVRASSVLSAGDKGKCRTHGEGCRYASDCCDFVQQGAVVCHDARCACDGEDVPTGDLSYNWNGEECVLVEATDLDSRFASDLTKVLVRISDQIVSENFYSSIFLLLR